jgi:hypothetical protein
LGPQFLVTLFIRSFHGGVVLVVLVIRPEVFPSAVTHAEEAAETTSERLGGDADDAEAGG